jgi:hypothetical protein
MLFRSAAVIWLFLDMADGLFELDQGKSVEYSVLTEL